MESMAVKPDILCLNYLDYQKYIFMDGNNQYLITERNPKNLFTTRENLFELISKKMEK